MKKQLSIFIFSTMILSGSVLAGEGNSLEATLADSNWGGEKIPDGQQCQKFKGAGSTPGTGLQQFSKAYSLG